MSKFAGLNTGPVLGAGVAVIVLVVAATGYAIMSPTVDDAPADQPVASGPDAVEHGDAQPAPEMAAAAPPPAEAPEASVTSEATQEDAALGDREAAGQPPAPRIDTFRLEPDGQLLLAGRAEPSWETFVLLDGEPFAEITPDRSGAFVSFISLEQSDAPRVLSLLMRQEGAADIASLEDIIVMPFVAHEPLVEAPEAPQLPADTVASPTVEQAEAKPDDPPSHAQTVLRVNEEGVDVVQPAPSLPRSGGEAPEPMASLALDAISYTETGDVEITGRGQGEGFVRVYLDNAPIVTSQIEADGRWRSNLPEVDSGIYTLRVDEMDDEGTMVSRLETPFKREASETVIESRAAANADESDGQQTSVSMVTVQPGSTLWAISRERYGEGILYVRVFEANRESIRDPDLIYPGQVFTLPE